MPDRLNDLMVAHMGTRGTINERMMQAFADAVPGVKAKVDFYCGRLVIDYEGAWIAGTKITFSIVGPDGATYTGATLTMDATPAFTAANVKSNLQALYLAAGYGTVVATVTNAGPTDQTVVLTGVTAAYVAALPLPTVAYVNAGTGTVKVKPDSYITFEAVEEGTAGNDIVIRCAEFNHKQAIDFTGGNWAAADWIQLDIVGADGVTHYNTGHIVFNATPALTPALVRDAINAMLITAGWPNASCAVTGTAVAAGNVDQYVYFNGMGSTVLPLMTVTFACAGAGTVAAACVPYIYAQTGYTQTQLITYPLVWAVNDQFRIDMVLKGSNYHDHSAQLIFNATPAMPAATVESAINTLLATAGSAYAETSCRVTGIGPAQQTVTFMGLYANVVPLMTIYDYTTAGTGTVAITAGTPPQTDMDEIVISRLAASTVYDIATVYYALPDALSIAKMQYGGTVTVVPPDLVASLAGGIDGSESSMKMDDAAATSQEVQMAGYDWRGPLVQGYHIAPSNSDARAFRGGDSSVDYPVPRPRFSNRNQLAIVFDLCTNINGWTDATAGGNNIAAVLGMTALAYLQARRIPVTFALPPASIPDAITYTAAAGFVLGAPTWDQLTYQIRMCGGELICHSYSHDALHPGLPATMDPDYYETVFAMREIERRTRTTGQRVGYPCRAGAWAGMNYSRSADDIIGSEADTRRGQLVRANCIAYREWNQTPVGERDIGPGAMPPRSRLPASNVINIDYRAGLTNEAGQQAEIVKMLKFFAAGQNQSLVIWTHGPIANDSAVDPGAGYPGMYASVFKTLCDELAGAAPITENAGYLNVATPCIDVVPFSQLYYTYPCAVANRPNLIMDPSFESGVTTESIATDFPQWTPFLSRLSSTGLVVYSDVIARTGTLSLYIPASGTVTFNYLPVVPGEQYEISWFQYDHEVGLTAHFHPTVYFYDKDGNEILATPYNAFSLKPCAVVHTWERRRLQATAPMRAEYMKVTLTEAAAAAIYIDDVFVG